MTDEELRRCLGALRAGDAAAFAALYGGLSAPLYTVLLRITGHRQSAEDLLQETFLKLYQSPPGPEVRAPRAWIFKIARNLALDHLRARRPTVPLEAAERPAPAGDIDARLSPEDRQILVLRLNGALKFRELAAVLELPLGTMLRRYHNALGRLRDGLSP